MEEKKGKRKELSGKVVSDKMQKTIVVVVERKFRHPVYKKVVKVVKKYKVHSPENMAHTGDIVEIIETRPLSREKRWCLKKIVKKAKREEIVAAKAVEAK